MIPLPPTSTLFPYTTLFRSVVPVGLGHPNVAAVESCNGLLGGQAHPFVVCRPAAGSSQKQRRRRPFPSRSEEHTSELQSLRHLVCRLLLEKKKKKIRNYYTA